MTQSSESDNSNRLTYSLPGLLRATQMLGQECVVIVEGHEIDPFYYDSVLTATADANNVQLKIVSSREISASGRGKGRCLSYYHFLDSKKSLVSELSGKKTVTFFILDKDIDDLLQQKISCSHICYTDHHSVENHLVREADLSLALAAVSSQPPRTVAGHMQDSTVWRDECAAAWSDWIKCCIACQFVSKTCGTTIPGYSRPSPVNSPPDAPVDADKLAKFVKDALTRQGVSEADYKQSMRHAENAFDAATRDGRLDSLFKGKWYATFAQRFLASKLRINHFNEPAFWAALLARLDGNHHESNHFRMALSNLLNECFNPQVVLNT